MMRSYYPAVPILFLIYLLCFRTGSMYIHTELNESIKKKKKKKMIQVDVDYCGIGCVLIFLL